MKTDLMLSGLPSNVKISSLALFLKKHLRKAKVHNQFWIRELSDMRGSYLKEVRIEFQNYTASGKAKNILNGLEYLLGNGRYPLAAEIERGDRHNSSNSTRFSYDNMENNSKHYGKSYTRDRSRSPHYRESSFQDYDAKIEILRKQREIMEEERKLLIERKKLELIKEFGPRAAQEFDIFSDTREKQYYEEDRHERRYSRERERVERRPFVREHVERRPRERIHDRQSRPKMTTRPVTRPQNFLPQFILPCKKIIQGMSYYIMEQNLTPEQEEKLHKLISSTLRKRLAVALENKKRMKCKEIVNLYRSLYPPSTDKSLVDKMVACVKDYFLDSHEIKAEEKEKCNDDAGTTDEVEASGQTETVKRSSIDDNFDCGLSLEATDTELSMTANDDWIQSGTDWDEIKMLI